VVILITGWAFYYQLISYFSKMTVPYYSNNIVNRITSKHKRLHLEEKEAAKQLTKYQQKAAKALS
jgi:hypothetical protein